MTFFYKRKFFCLRIDSSSFISHSLSQRIVLLYHFYHIFLPPSTNGKWMAAGRIRFIDLNQPEGRTKFFRGPHLARGPDFGHACHR